MTKCTAFLQNAWSPAYAGRTWPRRSWLAALARSRSGQRLRVFEASYGGDVWYDNITPIVGATADSIIPADTAHIRRVLREQRPDCVVTFGRQAALAVTELAWKIPVLQLPHPAYRLVTNDLLAHAGKMVADGFWGIVRLEQKRGEIVEVTP